MKNKIFIIVMIALGFTSVFGQTRTVGLFVNDTSKVFKGYTLFAPKQNTMTYLINNEGRIVHKWTASKYPPGQSVYLLENGNLLRTCMTKGQLSSGGGEGGRVEEYNWNDSLVWSLDFSTSTYMQHHDIKLLPNGNIIMLVIEKKTYAECIAAGFDPSKFQPDIAQKGMMVPDYIVEIQPTKPVGGNVVWEWHTWDHLIQDYDATKLNYGVPKSHPELIDCDGDGRNLPAFWNHMNSIDYNPTLDQIAVSVRGNSEVWIIDHSTTTEEAKGHTGGKRGKGGDLIYRWGNPITYGAGTKSDQRYFEQHDVEWVLPGRSGAGNLTCFNNGLGRSSVYSTVDEFTPAINADGSYSITTSSAFLPANFTWTYQGDATNPLYSENISGAFRLPNGNTILCSGTLGLFLEVTSAKEIVWKYICPVEQTGAITQGSSPSVDPARSGETMNSVFRVYKYTLDYAAFTGKDLTPGDYVEKYTTGTISTSSNPANGGLTSGAGTFNAGISATVKATPNSGYTFSNWTESGWVVSTSSSYTFTISGPRTLVANFTSSSATQFSVTVSSNLGNGGTISGAGTYNSGSSVTVTATPNSGYTFTNWTENGTVVSTSSSYTFTISSNRILVANFAGSIGLSEALIPAGEFEMGDHFSFVDPSHPSDESPIHTVQISSFKMAKTETTNQQFLAFLNSSLSKGLIEVKNNAVYALGGSDVYCYTYQSATCFSIGYDGKVFSIVDFRANHPMVGVMWSGAAAYCNWLSSQNGYAECYNLKTWDCDFTKNGYRLPTEAEWEFAGRGGHTNPYLIYQNGNTIDVMSVNLPSSGDPYEPGSYPNTTPVGFYDGKLKLKSDYNWPGSVTSYQTHDGANGYGLYDMQGNAWEFVNDWYGQDYYSVSPHENPKGPTSGFIMPDGKPYRGMRGGNWYNGLVTNGVNDGHSRVSNRNPSYYRGPQDEIPSWNEVGFRVARNYSASTAIIGTSSNPVLGGTIIGAGTYDSGSTVTVVATPSNGYTFSNWTENGTAVSTSSSYSFTISSNRTLVANFKAIQYTIITSSSPSGGGTTSGSGTFNLGISVTVIATSNSGYTFTNWTENGTAVSTSSSYTFTLSANRTLSANFSVISPLQYSVNLSGNPTNGGTTSGAATYNSGSSVTITATPNSGYAFTNWTENGTAVSTNSSYTFTISGNRTFVANFIRIQYIVATSSIPINSGTTTGAATYNSGSSVTVTATPNNGYIFTNWTENGSAVSTNSSYTFTLGGNRTLVANFTRIQYAITTNSNPVNSGTVSGAGTYNSGNSVTVAATPVNGYVFTNWTENGMIVSTNSSYTFNINGNRTLTANFTRIQYTITMSSNPSNGGTTSGSGTFNSESSVTISATPSNGYKFNNWTEDGIEISKNGEYIFTITKNRNFIANFINTTSIEQVGEIPTRFALQQNYPNPFNPSTKIQFSIPKQSIVRLSIYNILGQEIVKLVDQELPASTYSVDFYATDLPDGIYFYKIQAGEFIHTKKMILTK